MYRFLLRPKWIGFHLLCVAVIVAMINLGFWQLRRLDEKRSFNERVRATANQPIAPFQEVVGSTGDDLTAIEYRRVEVTGRYLDREFEIVNVSQDGTSGHDQVLVMQLDDGTLLVVNRGFTAGASDSPSVPSGEVTLIGRIRRGQRAGTGQTADDGTQFLTEIRRVDLAALGAQFDQPLQPVYVDGLAEGGVEISGLDPIAFPALDEGPHLSYAIQWFIFTVAVAAGWVLAVRRSVTDQRERNGGGPPKRKKALIPEQYL